MPRSPFRLPAAAGAVLGAALLTLAAAVPATAAAATGSVTGVVTTAGAATTLAGATVTAETPQGQVLATTTSAADGSYTLTGVPAGARVVCADGSALRASGATAGWLPDCAADAPVHIGRGRTVTGVDRAEVRATAIQGRVTAPGGTPVVGARVVFGDDVPTQVTGADGRYRVVFDARVATYLTPYFDGTSATGAASTVGFLSAPYRFPPGVYSLQPVAGRTYALDQKLQPAATLSGRVHDADGTGLGGVTVALESADDAVYLERYATTAADGTWSVTGLPAHVGVTLGFAPGDTTTGPSPTGYLTQCWRDVAISYLNGCPYADGITTVVTPTGAARSGLDVTLHAAGGITGRITDSLGRPVPGAEVSTFGEIVDTDADGVYRFTGLTANPYYRVCTRTLYQSYPHVFPDPDGYLDTCWTDDGESDGSPIAVQVGQQVSGIDLVLQGRGGIAGRVLAPDGTAVADASVSVAVTDGPTGYTDGSGAFRVGGLPPGTYTLCFASTPYDPTPAGAPFGYGRRCQQVEVQDSVTTTLPDVTMVAGGRISGTVTDVYGFALGEVTVGVADAATGASVGTVRVDGYDPAGGWALSGLAPGRYTVCFGAADAYRTRDDYRPPSGYVSQCWKDRSGTAAPVVVTVGSWVEVTGISARIRKKSS